MSEGRGGHDPADLQRRTSRWTALQTPPSAPLANRVAGRYLPPPVMPPFAAAPSTGSAPTRSSASLDSRPMSRLDYPLDPSTSGEASLRSRSSWPTPPRAYPSSSSPAAAPFGVEADELGLDPSRPNARASRMFRERRKQREKVLRETVTQLAARNTELEDMLLHYGIAPPASATLRTELPVQASQRTGGPPINIPGLTHRHSETDLVALRSPAGSDFEAAAEASERPVRSDNSASLSGSNSGSGSMHWVDEGEDTLAGVPLPDYLRLWPGRELQHQAGGHAVEYVDYYPVPHPHPHRQEQQQQQQQQQQQGPPRRPTGPRSLPETAAREQRDQTSTAPQEVRAFGRAPGHGVGTAPQPEPSPHFPAGHTSTSFERLLPPLTADYLDFQQYLYRNDAGGGSGTGTGSSSPDVAAPYRQRPVEARAETPSSQGGGSSPAGQPQQRSRQPIDSPRPRVSANASSLEELGSPGRSQEGCSDFEHCPARPQSKPATHQVRFLVGDRASQHRSHSSASPPQTMYGHSGSQPSKTSTPPSSGPPSGKSSRGQAKAAMGKPAAFAAAAAASPPHPRHSLPLPFDAMQVQMMGQDPATAPAWTSLADDALAARMQQMGWTSDWSHAPRAPARAKSGESGQPFDGPGRIIPSAALAPPSQQMSRMATWRDVPGHVVDGVPRAYQHPLQQTHVPSSGDSTSGSSTTKREPSPAPGAEAQQGAARQETQQSRPARGTATDEDTSSTSSAVSQESRN
ncbi:uncharacterized protein PSFLO_07456 [Pseudozyma flocculosa]|uniref:BZIP domain-containing protein n=1 Tax=Pseudozyma flocculosa TaxID=84751 RepID=A0A5C3FC06_9BASI|nr:uncharacterized protein PSFLO_07456 [Pseudozyma flocculosa]